MNGRFQEYTEYDALGLAELVRKNAVSPTELLNEARYRLHECNPQINAVVTLMDELAETSINSLNRNAPFAGVPFLVKDLMLPFAGYPMSNGSRSMINYIPSKDSLMAERIKAAGLIVFGKTNTSELGASSLVNPVAFGETRNPWDLTRNSGGSSGGSSAAVAARIVPMAYSSDGGGSIRLPASYCGIFGFKPSRGINRYEDFSNSWGDAVVSHVSSLSVRDSAAYLDWVTGKLCDSKGIRNPDPNSYLSASMQRPEHLKIGLITESPIGTSVHEDCIAAAKNAASSCESLGHIIEKTTWNIDGINLMRAFLTVVFRFTKRDVEEMARTLKITPAELDIELNTRFMAEIGSGIDDQKLSRALQEWELARQRIAELHQRYDVILTPTVATPLLKANALDPNRLEKLIMRLVMKTGLSKKLFSPSFLDKVAHKSLYQTPFTPLANMTGQPAMSIPLYWDKNGLPHGAHFMAATGNDSILIKLAAQLEAAFPWKKKVPAFG